MALPSTTTHPVRVGIVGCGEVTQVIHLPTLNYLSHLFTVTYLCDVSPSSLSFCQNRSFVQPTVTSNPDELITSPTVDLVFIVNSDEYHCTHAVLALKHNKHVFVEKPMALCLRDCDRIVEAERESEGKVMVGYMRRYAAVFEDAIKEVGGMEAVLYARVRDIIAPNPIFVGQSGTFPRKFSDVQSGTLEEREKAGLEQVKQALTAENGVRANSATAKMWRTLGSLGSHDISLMRETLGMPQEVLGASLRYPIWTVLFKYPAFAVTYESGFDNVPRFDAHIEVYGKTKTVRVQYDTPYVKGLPIEMVVKEEGEDGVYQERKVRRTYEDPYTLELKELWEMCVNGKQVKTTAEDARKDLEVFGMVMKAANVDEAQMEL